MLYFGVHKKMVSLFYTAFSDRSVVDFDSVATFLLPNRQNLGNKLVNIFKTTGPNIIIRYLWIFWEVPVTKKK